MKLTGCKLCPRVTHVKHINICTMVYVKMLTIARSDTGGLWSHQYCAYSIQFMPGQSLWHSTQFGNSNKLKISSVLDDEWDTGRSPWDLSVVKNFLSQLKVTSESKVLSNQWSSKLCKGSGFRDLFHEIRERDSWSMKVEFYGVGGVLLLKKT